MKIESKRKLPKRLLIVQLSIYVFIIIHSIVWYVFGFHYLPKLCPGKLRLLIGSLEFNLNVLFWAVIFISTFYVGRAFCGWGCMWGAYQDFVSRAFLKLGIKGIKGKLRIFLFAILLPLFGALFISSAKTAWPTLFWFFTFVVIIGLIAWWFFERMSPSRTITTIPKYILLTHFFGSIISSWIILNVFDKGFSLALDKFGVLDDYLSIIGVIGAIVIFGFGALAVAVEKRFFCKYLCPYGLMLRFISMIPFYKRKYVKVTNNPCVQCTQCDKVCPMGINVVSEIKTHGKVKNSECINCLRCVAKCPKDSLDF